MEIAGTITAAAAAVAAIASWASVIQSRRVIRAAALPDLRAGVQYVQPGLPSAKATLAIEIHNGGGGTARDVGLLVVCESQSAATSVASFLRPRESAYFGTNMTPSSASSRVLGLLLWRDSSETIHAWSLDGRQQTLGGRRAAISLSEAWERFYPDRPLRPLKRCQAFRTREGVPGQP